MPPSVGRCSSVTGVTATSIVSVNGVIQSFSVQGFAAPGQIGINVGAAAVPNDNEVSSFGVLEYMVWNNRSLTSSDIYLLAKYFASKYSFNISVPTPPPMPPPSPSPPPANVQNIAYGAPWTSSGVLWGDYWVSPAAALRFNSTGQITNYATQCAFNGNAFGIFHSSCSDSMPSFTIDLGAWYKISGVTLYTRSDCCQNRMSQFQILARTPLTRCLLHGLFVFRTRNVAQLLAVLNPLRCVVVRLAITLRQTLSGMRSAAEARAPGPTRR